MRPRPALCQKRNRNTIRQDGVSFSFLTWATGETPKRCLWQMKRGVSKAAPRLAATNVADRRLAQRGHQPRRPQLFAYSPLLSPFSASWLGSLAAHGAATRTRAPKRATGTFLSLRSRPVRASACVMAKKETPSGALFTGTLYDLTFVWAGSSVSCCLPFRLLSLPPINTCGFRIPGDPVLSSADQRLPAMGRCPIHSSVRDYPPALYHGR